MTDRSILVRLRADVSDYVKGMVSAKKSTDDLGASAPKATGSLDKMVQSARANRTEWETTGKALLVVGGAIVGIGTAALKTGIDYNTLQQTSRAALKTLLGSAQDANAQMDKLDTFARTSPFAKQVFISAQQQMLGFGIEAKKVIPYLDAIQNAVAATGGSNDDIAQLTRIMSQIAASSKITAVDLMQFGQRGVDAATLIGSQMGKTGAQIRTEITAGTLDATTALDALAAGMEVRYADAAANVKTTFAGSLDRVKAAWRDLSGDLAAPFVDPNGGGMAITWLNDIADKMRAFQNLPKPVKLTIELLTGLVGIIAVLGGGFLTLAPRAVATWDALGKIGPAGVKAQAGLRATSSGLAAVTRAALPIAAVLSAVAFAAEGLAASSHHSAMSLDGTIAAMLRAKNAGTNLDELFNVGLGVDQVNGMADAIARVTAPGVLDRIQDVGGSLRGFFTFGNGGSTARTETIAQIKTIGDSLAGLVDQGNTVLAAQQFTDLSAAWVAGGGSVEELRKLMPGYQDALDRVANSTDLTARSTTNATGATDDLAKAQEKAQQAAQDWFNALAAGDGAFISIQDAYQGVIDKNHELAQAAADASKSSTDSWTDFYDGTTVSAADYIQSLQDQVTAQQNWEQNMVTIATRAKDGMTGQMSVAATDMLNELISLGPDGAAQVQLLASMSDEELAKVVALYAQKGGDAKTAFNTQMALLMNPTIVLETSTDAAQRAIDSFIRKNDGRLVYVNAAGDQVGFKNPGAMPGFAGGGSIPGTAPHPRADNVLIRATPGEYMQPVKAVNFWGVGFQEAVRRMDVAAVAAHLPGFADGGQVGRYVAPAFMSSGSSGAAGASLAGLEVTGTLDTPWGPAHVRGVVRDELATVARSASGTSSAPGRLQ